MVVLTEKCECGVLAHSLKDGQLAVITEWGPGVINNKNYIGRVVQRYETNLITVGGSYMKSWPNFFTRKPGEHDTHLRVQILEYGTTITVLLNDGEE